MIVVKVIGYWLVMHVLEGGEDYFVEDKEHCSYSSIWLVEVVFVKRFAN